MTDSTTANKETTKPKVLYITSPNFSGSTLVTALLGRHPRIATIGELKASALGDVRDYRCSCGEIFLECSFWSEFKAQMQLGTGRYFDLQAFGTHFRSDVAYIDRILRAMVRGPYFESLRRFVIRALAPAQKKYLHIVATNQTAIDVVINLQGGDVFLDGSKDPNRLLYLVESNLFDIKVLHLTRDGRGVSNSMRKHFGLTMVQAAKQWAQKTAEIETALKQIECDRVMRVVYEKFCEKPEDILDEILRFADVRPIEESSHRADDSMHLLGNNMRLINASGIVLDEKWRTVFNTQDHAHFESTAGAENRSLGYRS